MNAAFSGRKSGIFFIKCVKNMFEKKIKKSEKFLKKSILGVDTFFV